jgi:hypothetical protein
MALKLIEINYENPDEWILRSYDNFSQSASIVSRSVAISTHEDYGKLMKILSTKKGKRAQDDY